MPSAKEETGNNGLVSAWGSVLNFDCERWDSWCSRGILGLVLAILVWSPLATGAVRPQDFVIIEWLTVAILGVWLLRFWINPKHRLLWPWVCWPILGFVIYAVGRYLTADIEFVARQEMIQVL
ncbi:MAG: O-antigen polymerase, partial [Verrucomicrobiales bacterium]|nr:O-antigen polymerase [Verrucomicrobiales bacterium]